MTNLTDKLTEIKNCKTDIATAIEVQGIPVDGASFAEYAGLIGQINGSGSSSTGTAWKKPDDWPDIRMILANDTLPEGYVSSYIQLLPGDDRLFRLSPANAYRFSDAPDTVVTNSFTTRSWDASKDFPCSAGYKTRWVISYFDTDSVWTDVDINAIFCVFRCIYTSFFVDMKLLEAIDCLDGYYLKPSTANRMFQSDHALREVSCKIDLSDCINTVSMFEGCYKLTRIPRQLDLSKCRYASSMFSSCHSLEKFPATLDLSACTDATRMFSDCFSLVNLPKIYGMPSCTTVSYMFSNCYSLVSISNLFSLPSCVNTSYMFYNCNSLKKVPENLSLPACTNAYSMFSGCTSLVKAPDTIELPICTDASYMFSRCTALVKAPDNLDLGNCTNANYMFSLCYSLRFIRIQHLKTDFRLNDSGLIPRDTLVSVLESLETVSGKTLTLGSSLLGKLTAEDKAIATSKGWTLA